MNKPQIESVSIKNKYTDKGPLDYLFDTIGLKELLTPGVKKTRIQDIEI